MAERSVFKPSIFSALALAFASFGDAFLYPFLPVYYSMAGIPVAWVGLLLSVNRFIRIFSNHIMVYLFARYGLRQTMFIAVVCAIVSTTGYSFASGIVIWLLMRILWGLSFSAMRIGTTGYALQSGRHGMALGLSKSLQEGGPMIALFLAPILLSHNPDVRSIFLLLAALSLPALWFAWNLPKEEVKTSPPAPVRFFSIPSLVNSLTFFSAMIIDGVMIVVLGILFMDDNEHFTLATATAMAAFYLGYRRICLVLFSPVGGWMADKVRPEKVFSCSLALVVAGLVLIAFGWIGLGAIVVFTFYSIHTAVTPLVIAQKSDHALAAISENVTWKDLGAAAGALIGGLLIASPYLSGVILITIFILSILFLVRLETTQKAFKYLIYGSSRNL